MKTCLIRKWKDKISLERDDSQWFMALMEYWGEQKGKAFFQRLRAQNPRIRSGHTLQAQLIAAGEDALFPHTVEGLHRHDAPARPSIG